jgi:HlyD family secretion protein
VAGNDYCVKGTVSEQTIHTLQECMDVRILSRVDDTVWEGSIYKINTEETKQNNNRYYYYDAGSGEQASKYDFFVELGTNEGLLMGQHVYIEPGAKEDEADDALLLPFYYVVETEAEPFVYAANDENRIEKRPVVLGDRDDETGTVAILEGLGYLDRIAFPDETVQVGMAASETAYVPDDMGMDMGEPGGMDMGELGGMDLPDMPDMPDMDMPEANMPEEAPAEGAAG